MELVKKNGRNGPSNYSKHVKHSNDNGDQQGKEKTNPAKIKEMQ